MSGLGRECLQFLECVQEWLVDKGKNWYLIVFIDSRFPNSFIGDGRATLAL